MLQAQSLSLRQASPPALLLGTKFTGEHYSFLLKKKKKIPRFTVINNDHNFLLFFKRYKGRDGIPFSLKKKKTIIFKQLALSNLVFRPFSELN